MKQHFSTYEPMLQELRQKYEVRLTYYLQEHVLTHSPSLSLSFEGGDKGEDAGVSGKRQGYIRSMRTIVAVQYMHL